ncbi:hypothetical protein LK494_03025 [Anaerovorax odorimutans]|nr:hypothetical protein [Anaerovorax odorimutans]
MSKGLLYCAAKDTDCMEMYIGNGVCRRNSCVRDDPEYLEKEAAQDRRRNELLQKEREHRREEQTAATKIRRQTNILTAKEELERKKEKMERLYIRGMTRAADKLSREIGEMERRLKA